jgi:hypothetical protein
LEKQTLEMWKVFFNNLLVSMNLNTHLLYWVEVVLEGGDYNENICVAMSLHTEAKWGY